MIQQMEMADTLEAAQEASLRVRLSLVYNFNFQENILVFFFAYIKRSDLEITRLLQRRRFCA